MSIVQKTQIDDFGIGARAKTTTTKTTKTTNPDKNNKGNKKRQKKYQYTFCIGIGAIIRTLAEVQWSPVFMLLIAFLTRSMSGFKACDSIQTN